MTIASGHPTGGAGTAADSFIKRLEDYHIRDLSFLLAEKGYGLNIWSMKQDVIFTVNDIAIAVIKAYFCVFEKYCSGSISKSISDGLKDRDLNVVLSVQGGAVSRILGDSLSLAGVDLRLEFNKIPIPSALLVDPLKIQTFLHSQEGGLFLKGFYKEVAFEALAQLLSLKLPGIELDNINPFNNMLLFSGNSKFLLGLGRVNITFITPGMGSRSSLHAADSLEVLVPVDKASYTLLTEHAVFQSLQGVAHAMGLIQDKVIHIVDPEKIEFNGFERIIYAVTQGWSIPSEEALFVLLKQLFVRTTPEAQKTNLPFERFFFLINKKKIASGLGEVFCLRMFLNAYIASLHYAQKGEREAIFIADLFQEAFLHPDFKMIFPSYVRDNFSHFGDLDLLVAFEKLKLQLDSQSCKKVKFVSHLEKQACVIGDFTKEEGVLVDRFMSISECLTIVKMLNSHWPEEKLKALLDPLIKAFDTIDVGFEDKLICLLFMNQIQYKDPYSYIAQDLAFYQKTVLELITDHPSLFNIQSFKEGFIAVIEAIEIPNKKLIKHLLVVEKDIVLAALFFKLGASNSEEKSLEIIKGALKKGGLSIEKLVDFLISLKGEDLVSSQVLKWIELGFKSAEKNLPIELFVHPHFGKILDKIPLEFKWDLSLWKNSFWHIFAHSFDERIYPVYYKISTLNSQFFELSCPMVPLSIKKHLLTQLIKDNQQDLLLIFLSQPGSFDELTTLFKEHPSILKNKGLKNALISLSLPWFSHNIEQLLSKTSLAAQEMVLAMMEQEEFFTQFIAIADVLAGCAMRYKLQDRIYFFLIKYLNEGALCEKRAKVVLSLIKFLNKDDKSHRSVFKQAVDKWGALWLELERKEDDGSIKEAIYKIKEESIKLLALGLSFIKPWQLECEAFKWDHNTLEECIADYLKKPSEALIVAMHQRVQEKTSPIVEPILFHLKGYFSAEPVYLLSLFRHIGQWHLDSIKEKYAKEIFSILVEDSLRISFFYLYVEYSDSYKHLSTFMQPALLHNLDVANSVCILDKLFIKADDEIKVSVLHKFKDNSILRLDHVDLLFEFFKKISTPLIKKNSLLEFFYANFVKLKSEYQYELLIEPMMIEESSGVIASKSLLEKVIIDSKSCEMMNLILGKRGHVDFAIKNGDLFLHGRVLVDYFLANFHLYDLKYQEVIIKFIEKMLGVYKQEMGSIPLELLNYFMDKCSINPAFYSLVREGIEIDLDTVPVSFIFAFLDKIKENTLPSKGEGDKYLKIFKHLSHKAELERVMDHYLCFALLPYFQEGHKKEFLNMAIEKAILEKKQALLERLLGTKRSLGFGEDKKAQISGVLLKEASKGSKKAIELAFLDQIAKADTLLELNVNILNPLKLIIDAYGEEPFIEVKQQLKNRILENLHSNVAKAKTVYELIISVIQPLKSMASYFPPARDTNKLCLCVLDKFLNQGTEALEDTSETLEGFVELLSTIQTVGSIKHLLTGITLFDLSSKEVNAAIVDILINKAARLDKHVNLLSLIEKIATYEKRLLDPFLNKMMSEHLDIILRFFETSSEYQAVVFLSHLTKGSLPLYNKIAEKLVSRASCDERFKRSLIEVIRINLDKNLDAFSVVLKKLDRMLFFKKILESEFSLFTKMLGTYFDQETESIDMIDLLEARWFSEGRNMKFYLKLRNDPFKLHIFYMKYLSRDRKEILFSDLEKRREAEKASIHHFSTLLDMEDREMAKFFFQMTCEKNMALVIDELKATSFDHYFKCVSNIYYFWVIPGKYKELYPIIFEDALEKIQQILAKNEAEGELSTPLINGLIEVIGTLFDAYSDIIKATDYPFDKRFNPIFLKAFLVLLEPNNILKKYGDMFPKLEMSLNLIKESHLKTLFHLENKELIESFFKSILRFCSLEVVDFFKDLSSLKTTVYKELGLAVYTDMKKMKLKLNMMAILWMPTILEQKVDLFLPFITSTWLVQPSSLFDDSKLMYYTHLYRVCDQYLSSLIKGGYKPLFKEAILTKYLEVFNIKKTTRAEREHTAMAGFFTKSAQELGDFTYWACLKKKEEAEQFLKTLKIDKS